ncbi:L-ascorbate metabolism protein UlaG (beta-lactamase superfamily) [Natranaerovirga hydrolytica]|uniref:L-ascorbate metabolism protein UlaG (Beta-lactamase superfamily) n=1 Tax=Natranaerovirga hydrolytica TaxID=680378 RepID=A0A4R1MB00_9FIRM|nr:MBL fold metallo-hydrolase [Natranaerovirga hydrolytica]TCK89097.1 L-ascorbate metabolism protein UlaG (beta-lactamase superfamily) [Natranaerovirga hydrolytica]
MPITLDSQSSYQRAKKITGARRRRALIAFIGILAVLAAAVLIFLKQPHFGKLPEGQRMERIRQSLNYHDGEFKNREETSRLREGASNFDAWLGFFFGRNAEGNPDAELPSIKPDLAVIPPDQDTVVWMGHSSLYIRLGGMQILVDPVFSDYASPVPFVNRTFAGTNVFGAEDIPRVDLLIITHDHWDHLDYYTITALIPKIRNVVCPLGVGAHLEHWGVAPEIITELDWDESANTADGITVHALTARHYSGRALKNNQSLWASYVLETPGRQIYLSGDSGYGRHFKEIGQRFDLDFAILENGQYNVDWPDIHLLPEDIFAAADDLKVDRFMTIHNGRFNLARHSWNDPYDRLLEYGTSYDIRALTPMIGEPVVLDSNQTFSQWWK